MTLFSHNLARWGQDVAIETRARQHFNGQVSEVFATFADPVRAIIKTVAGVSVFDDTNTERIVTHELCIAYLSGVTAEKWVKLGTKRIKILSVLNCGERNEVMKLFCTERGEDSKVVNSA